MERHEHLKQSGGSLLEDVMPAQVQTFQVLRPVLLTFLGPLAITPARIIGCHMLTFASDSIATATFVQSTA